MERIIAREQDSAPVDPEMDERIEIKSALCLIKSGERNLIRKGIRRLIRIAYGFELNDTDLLMLAARKAIFVEQVESYGGE